VVENHVGTLMPSSAMLLRALTEAIPWYLASTFENHLLALLRR